MLRDRYVIWCPVGDICKWGKKCQGKTTSIYEARCQLQSHLKYAAAHKNNPEGKEHKVFAGRAAVDIHEMTVWKRLDEDTDSDKGEDGRHNDEWDLDAVDPPDANKRANEADAAKYAARPPARWSRSRSRGGASQPQPRERRRRDASRREPRRPKPMLDLAPALAIAPSSGSGGETLALNLVAERWDAAIQVQTRHLELLYDSLNRATYSAKSLHSQMSRVRNFADTTMHQIDDECVILSEAREIVRKVLTKD